MRQIPITSIKHVNEKQFTDNTLSMEFQSERKHQYETQENYQGYRINDISNEIQATCNNQDITNTKVTSFQIKYTIGY